MKFKVGQIVRSTGIGISKSWGNYIGEIKKMNSETIVVFWNELNREVEMNLEEIEILTDLTEVKKLCFNDKLVIHTHGPLKVVEFSDGFYVVGEGKLIPVKNFKNGQEIIEKLKRDPT
jgi:hypothetical protein